MSKKKDTADDPIQMTEALSSSLLREMVNNLEETKLKLLLNIKELKEKLAQQKEDQTDIYYFLNKKCDESFEVIASLEEQILNEQADREIAEKLYENKLEDMRNAALSTEAKYNTRISELESRLEMLNSFSEIKDETEQNLKNLMSKLEEERIQFSINAENMENKFLLEREKLRKSYDVKYENIKRELELSIDGKLTKKTKKTQIMNIIMKKELDSQSKHAEKLLEINQSILERDRELKLELELSTSLQAEMTSKLAMYQRVIKQMNEKVAAMELAAEETRIENERQLSAKEEEMIRLEARVNHMNKKSVRENSKLDDMWRFISQSYQLIKAKSNTGSDMVGNDCSNSVTSSIATRSSHMDHELLLVELIREVTHRHPKALAELMMGNQQGVLGATSDFTAVRAPVSIDQSASLFSVHDDSLLSHRQPPQQSSVSVHSSFATGIPTWDVASELQMQNKSNFVKKSCHSVGVQTDAKLAPYPQGSSWLDSAVMNGGNKGNTLVLARDMDIAAAEGTKLRTLPHNTFDDPSLDMQSMPSLWGHNTMDGGASVSMLSHASGESYSIKTASYILPTAGKNASRQKALNKFKLSQINPPPSHFRDLNQILSDSASSGRSGRSHGVKLVPARHAVHTDFTNNSMVIGTMRPHSPPPLSTGERHEDRKSVSKSADFRSGSSQQNSQYGNGPAITISGQGFVSPFALPKIM